jgi:hypothetical protein
MLGDNGMNIKASIPKFAFALVLIGLSLDSSQKIFVYTLVVILVLYGIVILFENISQKPIWKTIVSSTKDLDITYLAFGFGMISLSTKMLADSSVLAGIILLVSGVLLAGWNIGQLIGKGSSKILSHNVGVGIVLGSVMLIGGLIWLVMNWNKASINTISDKLSNAIEPIVVVCIGIMLIYFGWRRWRSFRRLQ